MSIQQTSLQSYIEIQPQVSDRHAEILYALRLLCQTNADATDQELRAALGKSDPNYVRPRRNELMKQGLIIEAQKRQCRVTGKTAKAWRLT